MSEKYKLIYRLRTQSDEIVDETGDDNPLIFEYGDGQLDQCLESCIREAKIGVNQTFLLSPDMAFGQPNDEAIKEMEISSFPKDLQLKKDLAVEFQTPTGDSFVGVIRDIGDFKVSVDFNHPLAGCNLTFEVKVEKANF
jgi:FKBP-type peptidyl-prolyl cis-trans isomerase 2